MVRHFGKMLLFALLLTVIEEDQYSCLYSKCKATVSSKEWKKGDIPTHNSLFSRTSTAFQHRNGVYGYTKRRLTSKKTVNLENTNLN